MKKAIYEFTPNSKKSTPPKKGEHYLVAYRDSETKKTQITPATWQTYSDKGYFAYNERFVLEYLKPSLTNKESRHYVISWAHIQKDWKAENCNKLPDNLTCKQW
jgi:hypothetical protein